MFNEAKLNTIIKNSINIHEWAFKIPDHAKGKSFVTNPFDGFGILNNKPLYYETKLIKKGIYAFSFDRIEEHQWKNLKQISDLLKDNCYCFIFVGFYEIRKLKIVMVFDFNFLWQEKQLGRKSFTKKELMQFYNDNKYLPIQKVLLTNDKKQDIIEGLESIDTVIIGKK